MPRGAKWSSNVDFTLRIDERALDAVGSGSGCSSSSSGGSGQDVASERRALASGLLGADMKSVIKLNLRFLKTQLVKHQAAVKSSVGATGEEVAGAAEKRAALLRTVGEAEAALATLEAAARREAEAGDARLAEGAGALAGARGECAQRRSSAEEAAGSAGELSAGVLRELRASIASMEAAQRTERQRMSDLVARCLLRVSEHKQETRTRVDNAAAAVITAKNRVGVAEGERAGRMRGGST